MVGLKCFVGCALVFPENLASFILLPPFWDMPFCFIKDNSLRQFCHLNPYQPCVVLHIETSQVFCRLKQMAGSYMKCSTGLKWVKCWGILMLTSCTVFFDLSRDIQILKGALYEGNFIFCCTGQTDPNFRQIKIIIISILILHIIFFLLFIYLLTWSFLWG